MRTNWTSRLGRASAALAIAGLAVFAAGASAEAREYRSWNHHHHWNNGWQRGTIIGTAAGTITGGAAGTAGSRRTATAIRGRSVTGAPIYRRRPTIRRRPTPIIRSRSAEPELHNSAARNGGLRRLRGRATPWRVFFVTGGANMAETRRRDSRQYLNFLRDESAPACVPSDVSGGIAQCVSPISSAPPSAPVFSSSPPPAAPKPTITIDRERERDHWRHEEWRHDRRYEHRRHERPVVVRERPVYVERARPVFVQPARCTPRRCIRSRTRARRA